MKTDTWEEELHYQCRRLVTFNHDADSFAYKIIADSPKWLTWKVSNEAGSTENLTPNILDNL